MPRFRFDPVELPPHAAQLRADVREHLAGAMAGFGAADRAKSWAAFDPEFSAKLGAAGYIGMTFPTALGGHGRSALDRYIVLEELLAAGAPVAAHWTADRQSGPLIIRFGQDWMKQEIIPRIVRGECYFCIGMSEPDSGSDLASIRTKAVKVDGGWRVDGTKLWTSNAHRAHYMIALVRTHGGAEARHAGLSQLLIDLTKTDGITVRPIRDLAGDEHFNEVVFQDAFVPETHLIGEAGRGWAQVMAELAFERAGPERYMSAFELMKSLARHAAAEPSAANRAALGRLVAHFTTLRNMSVSIAGMLEAGEDPALQGSIVKDLGTSLEQSIPVIAHQLIGAEADPDGEDELASVLAYVTQAAPSFSLRGGTREVLRGIIARGLGLR